MKWNSNDIIFWFKIKLNYFNNVKITSNNNQDEKEDGVNVVNFDVIYYNLESQSIRSKFLPVLDKSDLEHLGFNKFEYQHIIQNSIKILVEKYPIPQENAQYQDEGVEGLEGLEGQVMGNTSFEQESIDLKYLCPITNELMYNPVIAYDGITYEKQNIINYLKQHYKTPKSQQVLKNIQQVNESIEMMFDDLELRSDKQWKKLTTQ